MFGGQSFGIEYSPHRFGISEQAKNKLISLGYEKHAQKIAFIQGTILR